MERRGENDRAAASIKAAYRGPILGMSSAELVEEATAWIQALGGWAAIGAKVEVEVRGLGLQLAIKASQACCDRLFQLPLEAMCLGGSYPAKVGAVEVLEGAGENIRRAVGGSTMTVRLGPGDVEVRPTRTGDDLPVAAKRRRLRGKQRSEVPYGLGTTKPCSGLGGIPKQGGGEESAKREDSSSTTSSSCLAGIVEDGAGRRRRRREMSDAECGGHRRRRKAVQLLVTPAVD